MASTDIMLEDTPRPARSAIWIGRILSALPVLALAFSAVLKIHRSPEMLQFWTGKFGYPESAATPIGAVELLCAALYAIPQTAVLGAALVSAYFGAAVATHVRVGDPFLIPIVLGVLVWIGLWLRDERLRAIFPFRRLAR
jgi:DoxX-like family